MKNLIVPLTAAIMLIGPAAYAASPSNKDATKEGAPTSTRSPGKEAATPANQVDTTKSGETSDRTPKNHADGAATGEKGASMGSGEATNQAWNATYQSDIAQEKQLKAGGGSK
jgi:hypothetical protein